MALRLEIVTPDRMVLSRDAEYVSIPGVEGVFGVMRGHIPFLSALAVGALHYDAGDKTRYVFISGGFAEVRDDTVTILAESAEEMEHIDFARAEAARKRAEERLTHKTEAVNEVRAQAALHRAVRRLSLRERS